MKRPKRSWDSDTTLMILKIVAELLDGERHSRHTIHRATGRSPGTADRWMRWIVDTIPGARLEKIRTTTWVAIKGRSAVPGRTAVYGACVAASLASLFAGTPHERNVREARDYLLRERGMTLGDLDRKLVFCARSGDPALPGRGGELDEVIDATLQSRRLRFHYRHGRTGETKAYDVEALSVLIFDHQFYLLGRLDDASLYPFRFGRMTEIEATVSFEYPGRGTYEPRELLDTSFGIHIAGMGDPCEIELLLSGPWARHATTHRWHSTQQLLPGPSEDTTRLVARIPLCPEVETWVLGFGDAAEVVRPQKLRTSIAKKLASAARRYEERTRSVARAQPRAAARGRQKSA